MSVSKDAVPLSVTNDIGGNEAYSVFRYAIHMMPVHVSFFDVS